MRKFKSLHVDAVIALSIFLYAGCFGAHFIATTKIQPHFYQNYFCPAVMVACGKGFVNLDGAHQPPDLIRFLDVTTDTFSCDELSDAADACSQFQKGHRYLLEAVAFVWKVFGVSWSGLYILYGIFFALSAVAAYGIFRLAGGKVVSVFATLVFVHSALQLVNLPHLRDYAKAPFVLLVILAMGWLVRFPLRKTQTFLVVGLAGGACGLGIGFRQDLLAYLPLFLLALWLFAPDGPSKTIKSKALATVLFLAVFVLVGLPILHTFGEGSNTFHVILLGLGPDFDAALGIQPSVYQFLSLYHDKFLEAALNSFMIRTEQASSYTYLATAAYDRASLSYYLQFLFNFPADFLARYYAAILNVLQYVKPAYVNEHLPGVINSCLAALGNSMLLLTALTILAVASKSFRLASFVVLVVLFVGGYPSLQYDTRHSFHLQFIPLWILTFLTQVSLRFLHASAADVAKRPVTAGFPGGTVVTRKELAHGFIFLLVTAAIFAGSLQAVRQWQQNHLVAFFEKYELFPKGKAGFLASADGKNPRFLFSGRGDKGEFPVAAHYFAADFDPKACGKQSVSFETVYESPSKDRFTEKFRVDISSHPRFFFVAYEPNHPYNTFSFQGLNVSQEDAACLVGIDEIQNVNTVPLLLNLSLPLDWKTHHLYQSIDSKLLW